MEFVMSRQGAKLNNFDEVRLDYFDRETRWADFADLCAGQLETGLKSRIAHCSRFMKRVLGTPTSRSLFVTACSR